MTRRTPVDSVVTRRRSAAFALMALLAFATTADAGPSPSAKPDPPPVPPSILLITADSLRADRVDLDAPDVATRWPALARLAREGARFDNAWTVAPWTAPALVSIFTGLHPTTHGVEVRDDTTPRELPTLPRILGGRGWTLGNFGFFAGASYYRNLGLPEASLRDGEETPTEAFRRWLEATRPPFFAWVHAIEPHLPYGAGGYAAPEVRVCGSGGLEAAQVAGAVPLADGWRFDAGDREKLLALYDDDITLLDRSVGRLLGLLDAAGLADSTLVVLTTDHGEELLEDGFVGHASTAGEAKLTRELLRIPWLVRGPGVRPGCRIPTLAQNVDVAPTLLGLVAATPAGRKALEEVPDPGFGMQGISHARELGGGRRADGSSRRLAAFSTSLGGHRTPEARRGERLLGMTDGYRLHVERLAGPPPFGFRDATAPELAGALEAFRAAQARARLSVLERFGGERRPDPAEVERWAESLPVHGPAPEARLEFGPTRGTIRIAWDGGEKEARTGFWVEYEATGTLASLAGMRGAFSVDRPEAVFGPFPAAFWNDVAGWAPFRFRVLDPARGRRSAWIRFELVPVAADAAGGAP